MYLRLQPAVYSIFLLILCESHMIQDLLMQEILLKEHSEIPLNSKQCFNHENPVTFPIYYEECPACDFENC